MPFISNKSRTHRKKKELFVIIFVSIILISTIFIYTYVINSPAFITDVPRINITYEEKPDTDDFVMCTFELISDNPEENVEPIQSKLKIKGSPASWKDKKSYRLELPFQKSLLGMRKDDDWFLMGMFLDYTRMRTKLSIDLYQSLEPTNPTAILPDSEYICLYINGEFEGLYLLVEKIDRRLFNLDDPQNNIKSSLIFQAKYYTNFREYDRDSWEQDWPNEDENIYIMDEMMSNLIFFVNNASDEAFFDSKTGIYTIFDKSNLIDFYLYNFFILHKDFWYKNYLIVRNTYPSKFYLIPWDFDASFGQLGWRFLDSDLNPEASIRSQHELFNRLLSNEEFMKNCKNRWFTIREKLWTDSVILDMLSDIYKEIKNILEYEMKLWEPETVDEEPEEPWPDGVIYSTKEFDLDEYISKLYQFIPNRLEFCDSYFFQY